MGTSDISIMAQVWKTNEPHPIFYKLTHSTTSLTLNRASFTPLGPSLSMLLARGSLWAKISATVLNPLLLMLKLAQCNLLLRILVCTNTLKWRRKSGMIHTLTIQMGGQFAGRKQA